MKALLAAIALSVALVASAQAEVRYRADPVYVRGKLVAKNLKKLCFGERRTCVRDDQEGECSWYDNVQIGSICACFHPWIPLTAYPGHVDCYVAPKKRR